MRDPQSITVNEDTRLIPVWSIVVAITAFVLVEYYFWLILPTQQRHPPPLGFHIYFSLSGGVLIALYFLMVGYVSKDAVPGLLNACAERLSLLPAVRLPACGELRELFPHGAHYGSVLYEMRA